MLPVWGVELMLDVCNKDKAGRRALMKEEGKNLVIVCCIPKNSAWTTGSQWITEDAR